MNKPEVRLINFTPDALELLIYTKSTRLKAGTTLSDIKCWSYELKMEHLEYMLNTIKSSFDFVDYVFEIKNVSRAFTHQLVRTRTGSYQQQSQRTVDASGFDYLRTSDDPMYTAGCEYAIRRYEDMVAEGMPVQDARGVLPTAIHTEIMMKGSLRTFSQMAELRLCKRTQGEYQDVFKLMVKAILEVHPWAHTLLECYCVKYAICAFPRYTKCPVQKHCFNPDLIRKQVRAEWESCTHVANPKVNKEGFTM